MGLFKALFDMLALFSIKSISLKLLVLSLMSYIMNNVLMHVFDQNKLTLMEYGVFTLLSSM